MRRGGIAMRRLVLVLLEPLRCAKRKWRRLPRRPARAKALTHWHRPQGDGYSQVPRQQAVMPQARSEVVRAFTTWPTTNQGCRLMNTAAFTMKGAVSAIQQTAAKRKAPV